MSAIIDEILLSARKILVVGDIILDKYINGEISRLSQEAPVPIMANTKTRYELGGASNVCINLHLMGIKADLMGCIGIDRYGKKVLDLLEEDGIPAEYIFQREEIVTTVKTRYVSDQGQQLLRVDRECYQEYPEPKFVLSVFKNIVTYYSLVVFSDYAKGFLSDELIEDMLNITKHYGIKTIVDPKNANLSKYQNCYLLKPNLKEFCELYSREVSTQYILDNSEKILDRFGFPHILITCGSNGIIYLKKGQEPFYKDAVCAYVADTTGAGDVVTAALAIGIFCGLSEENCVSLANKCGGLAVEKLGTSQLDLDDLKRILCDDNRVLKQFQALPLLREYYRDKKIVFTYGCFDMLHVGHMDLLSKAKRMGNVLVVGINSDQSIDRLKGRGRRIFNLDKRVQHLFMYSDADWLVECDEDKLSKLIEELRPDILVKSEDCHKGQVIGDNFVESIGGKVILLPRIHNQAMDGTVFNYDYRTVFEEVVKNE